MPNEQPSNNIDDDDVPAVVIEQTLLKLNETFVYRIPPMRTSGGHRAEDWNLATPLETCSLAVIRRDSALQIQLMSQKPMVGGPKGATESHLFAQCDMEVNFDEPSKDSTDRWVEAVVDSSRYFCIKIGDPRTGREAHIGMGFRDRDDAINFKMSLQDYEKTLRREQKAQEIQMAYETTSDANTDIPVSTLLPSVGDLSIKEGEKIHITLKNKGADPNTTTPPRQYSHGGGANVVGKGGLLLKKPPPPATASSTLILSPGGIQMVKNDRSNVPSASQDLPVDDSSMAPQADVDMDDDEWGDFESGN
mmetsp:Transcript_17894/g.32403  ORF Transcript_17894/g.32403 Transcript_17894/m.32403 type:complete len:306 (-) Transcript_17894:270-1187(-)|eukprot:CAMPEP_0198289882 /NCGR_PEP_ID=MMETSP1449-20131203/7930_1 /TAXON_ID=420275 /ORGANISM="Attheya septentrionalis, Strain CCMP2084" /LENGTH=305 /DNA_ID=CAMNT_0043988287 /DNA_START=69 /DNA_END=986 /DNA_ORIENTATION=-